MRIAFLNDITVMGGGELWVLNTCRHLKSSGHHLSVISPYGSPLYTACRAEGIDTFTYMDLDDLPFYDPLFYFLKQKNIDILYCTVIGRFCESRVLERIVNRINKEAGFSKTALILKTGLPPMGDLTPEYYGLGAGPAVRRIHVVSANTKRSFEQWQPEMKSDFLKVVYEGVDLDRFHKKNIDKEAARQLMAIPDGFKVVTCLARLNPMKGQDNLILAINELVKTFPDTIFLFVGDGEDKERLEQLVSYLKLENNVRFPGHVEDVEAILAITDILCHPSLNDGLPNSVVESMAMSVPVIASHVGGIPEIIENDVSGILVAPHDIHALVAGLSRLLADEGLRTALGDKAGKMIRTQFDLKENLKKLLKQLKKSWKTSENRTMTAKESPMLSPRPCRLYRQHLFTCCFS